LDFKSLPSYIDAWEKSEDDLGKAVSGTKATDLIAPKLGIIMCAFRNSMRLLKGGACRAAFNLPYDRISGEIKTNIHEHNTLCSEHQEKVADFEREQEARDSAYEILSGGYPYKSSGEESEALVFQKIKEIPETLLDDGDWLWDFVTESIQKRTNDDYVIGSVDGLKLNTIKAMVSPNDFGVDDKADADEKPFVENGEDITFYIEMPVFPEDSLTAVQSQAGARPAEKPGTPPIISEKVSKLSWALFFIGCGATAADVTFFYQTLNYFFESIASSLIISIVTAVLMFALMFGLAGPMSTEKRRGDDGVIRSTKLIPCILLVALWAVVGVGIFAIRMINPEFEDANQNTTIALFMLAFYLLDGVLGFIAGRDFFNKPRLVFLEGKKKCICLLGLIRNLYEKIAEKKIGIAKLLNNYDSLAQHAFSTQKNFDKNPGFVRSELDALWKKVIIDYNIPGIDIYSLPIVPVSESVKYSPASRSESTKGIFLFFIPISTIAFRTSKKTLHRSRLQLHERCRSRCGMSQETEDCSAKSGRGKKQRPNSRHRGGGCGILFHSTRRLGTGRSAVRIEDTPSAERYIQRFAQLWICNPVGRMYFCALCGRT
jgi:hypothetical protein